MGISLGGLGLSSFRNPFADFLAKGDLRSLFCLIVFLIISVVLAYLTNPSENSFRAYLTEQSFRLHLSRLDENAEDPLAPNHFRSRYRRSESSAPSSSTPFHFASRASIALRTPKHVFHSFGIFTIAAMVPLSKASDTGSRESLMISDSWYIGAFGKWWRGGIFEAWYQDVIARSKDEESWSSGILNMKRLDMLQDYNGPTFFAKNLPSHLMKGSPPRLRNRERPALRLNGVQQRSSTPPPLPKSVSLPMHTTRKSSSNGDRIYERTTQLQPQSHISPCLSTSPSRSSSALFDQSPLIAEILRQITTTKASVIDLRTQLSECESAASHSRTVLQQEVETHRDRKRQEDASKLELKARTKSLEDSKRGAESTRKEAEKRLKAAQSSRDGATQRMEFLDKEISGLQQNLSEDQEFILNRQGHISDEERDMTRSLEEKRQEIKASEDILLDLNQRSRELEEKLASEKERLRVLRAETEKLKRNRAISYPYHEEPWPFTVGSHSPTTHVTQNDDGPEPPLSPLASKRYSNAQDIRNASIGPNPGSRNVGHALQNISSIPSQLFPSADMFSQGMGNPRHSIGKHSILETPHMQLTKAADHLDESVSTADEAGVVSRSFQSESDPFVDRNWHRPSAPFTVHYSNDEANSNFSAATSPSASFAPENRLFTSPFDIEFIGNGRSFTSAVDHKSQVQSWSPAQPDEAFFLDQRHSNQPSRTPGWGSVFARDKTSTKALNPDAKEFSLFRKPATGLSGDHSRLQPVVPKAGGYDALNPNGLGQMTSGSTSSTNQSLLRAFAPSPAEREALQRALGGSSNTSFEMLPSLSDVGSIPASPTHAHALPHISHHPSGRDLGSILPLWLQGLPRTRKVNFSPWEDEEPLASGGVKESMGRKG